ARALLANIVSPGIIRILTHSLPQLEMWSLDVLTSKSMKLRDDIEWDDDGETV
ncbi:hypothetical protein P154DRAFT_409127, partial [Amniculicola lignicola CBS 123094]